MMTKIIVVTNQKGGVGKTTTTHALSAGFVKRGYKVLDIDMDPQGNLSFSFGADTEDGPTSYEFLKGDVKPQYAIQRFSSVDIISANILLSGIELEFNGRGREYLLTNAIKPIIDKYDYIFIDTPPALNILTVNSFIAADYLIIPMLTDIFSLQGIAQLGDTISRIKSYYNNNLVIGGILLNKYDGRTLLSKTIRKTADMIAEQMGTKVYKSVIRSGIAAGESQTAQKNLYDYAPKSNIVKDYNNFINELLNEGF